MPYTPLHRLYSVPSTKPLSKPILCSFHTVQWYLRDQEIDFNDPNLQRKALGPVGVLWVNPVSSSYFGFYTCEATNTLGTSSLDLELKEAHKPGPIASAKVCPWCPPVFRLNLQTKSIPQFFSIHKQKVRPPNPNPQFWYSQMLELF